MRTRFARSAAVLLLALVGGCTASHGGSAATSTATSPATSVSIRPLSSPSRADQVHVLGLWSGPEFDSFDAVKSAWENDTGGSVEWEASDDIPTSLGADVQAGTPPDLAVLPNLQLMRQLAADRTLVPLDDVLGSDQIHADYAPAWTDLGSYDKKLYGLFYKVTDKSTVWYSPKAFRASGYDVPKTWTDLTTLAATIRDSGHTPFSIVAASGPVSGWPLTDWISQLVLSGCGPTVYDGWIASDVAWTSPCVKHAFELFRDIVATKGNVFGGVLGILSTTRHMRVR